MRLIENGRKYKDRVTRKIFSSLIPLSKKNKILIKTRIGNIVLGFMKLIEEKNDLKKLTFGYIDNIRSIQIKWKGMIRLNNTRKIILNQVWNDGVKTLIKGIKSKDKNQLRLRYKLEVISNNIVRKFLNNYYQDQKRKYYKYLGKVFSAVKVMLIYLY